MYIHKTITTFYTKTYLTLSKVSPCPPYSLLLLLVTTTTLTIIIIIGTITQGLPSSVQFSHSVVSDSATPWIAAHQAFLSITNSRSSLRLMSIKSVMPSSHLILCHPLLLLPPIPPSISLFQGVNSSHEVAKVLEFQPQHQSFQWTPRTDLL